MTQSQNDRTEHDPGRARQADAKKLVQWVQQQAGISRRKAEELIDAGEVSVNGVPAGQPFEVYTRETIDRLSLRGHPLAVDRPEPRVYRYHKPGGVLCSHDDPFYGNTVGRILRTEGFIGYTWIGRLDQDSEGLLLLTNDGAMVHAFTHPRYEVEKVYHVWLARMPKPQRMARILSQMMEGIVDKGDQLRAVAGRVEGRPPHVQLTLTEGKKHEVKRLFAHFELSVKRLLRVSIASVRLADLPPGRIERLGANEAEALRAFARRLQQ